MTTIRTFQHRVTMANVILLIIVALLALYFLWRRTTATLLMGCGLVAVVVMLMEQLLHTTYQFQDDQLMIRRGRFSREERVPVKEIIRITPICRRWLFVSYLLIEYGGGHAVAVQPQNEDAFLKEIKKRQDDNETVER